jgi:hypothetical protein
LTNVTRAIARGVARTATAIGMVTDLWGGGPGSYRIVDANGSVVAGDRANADGGSGLDFADHGEPEPTN